MLSLVKTNQPTSEGRREAETNKQRFRLATLLRSTEEILHFAQLGDWESVEKLEKQRQEELLACFAHSADKESPLIAEALATLLFMNNQITDLVKKAKADLVEQQKQMQSQKSVADHYKDHR